MTTAEAQLRDLKYTDRPEFRDRASLEANFRQHFRGHFREHFRGQALNHVRPYSSTLQGARKP